MSPTFVTMNLKGALPCAALSSVFQLNSVSYSSFSRSMPSVSIHSIYVYSYKYSDKFNTQHIPICAQKFVK